MTRAEAITYIIATEMQCVEEFASTDEQRQYALEECHEALKALGVSEQELESFA